MNNYEKLKGQKIEMFYLEESGVFEDYPAVIPKGKNSKVTSLNVKYVGKSMFQEAIDK